MVRHQFPIWISALILTFLVPFPGWSQGALVDDGFEIGDLEELDVPADSGDFDPGDTQVDQDHHDLGRWEDDRLVPLEAAPSSPAAHRDPSELRQFTIGELALSALNKNPRVRMQSLSINAAHEAREHLKRAQLPLVTLSTAFRNSNNEERYARLAHPNRLDRLFGSVHDDNSLITGISAKVPLYHGDGHSVPPRAARVKERMETIKRQIVIEDILTELVTGYGDVLREEARTMLAHETLTLRKRELADVRDKFKGDPALGQKIFDAQMDIAKAEKSIMQASNHLLASKEQLAITAGLPAGVDFHVEDRLFVKLPESDLPALLESAKAANLHLKVRTAMVDLANEQIALVKSRDDPRLDLDLDYYGHLYLADSDLNADVYTVLCRFSWDLFDGGRTDAARREATHVRDRIVLERARAEADVMLAVRTAFDASLQASRLLNAATDIIRQARAHLRTVRSRESSNVLTRADVHRAKVGLLEAIAHRQEISASLARSRADLLRLCGKLDPTVF